jgi:hypothetical protein
VYSPIQDIIFHVPGSTGELASINTVYSDVVKEKEYLETKPEVKKPILQFFQF